MRVPRYSAYRRTALNLARQRLSLQQGEFTELTTLQGFERRLLVYLYALARVAQPAETLAKPTEAFVAAACAGIRGDSEALAAVLEAVSARVELRDAAVEAMVLFPPGWPDDLLRFYDAQPAARIACFEVCCRRGWEPEAGRVAWALRADADPGLRAGALRCIAEQPGWDLERFRCVYTPVAQGDANALQGLDGGVLPAALWGGLVRGDPDSHGALHRAIAATENATTKARLLRLAALSGDPRWLPVLLEMRCSDPALAMRLLALHGSRESVPAIIEGLDRAAGREEAASAWRWITGARPLPRRPLLEVVEADGSRSTPTGEDVPDAEYAANWWARHEAELPQTRLALGHACDERALAVAARRWGGEAGRCLAALLLLATGGRVRFDADGLATVREQVLGDCGIDAGPALPADLDSLDPWEHAHYA